jgi:hypothetical protein
MNGEECQNRIGRHVLRSVTRIVLTAESIGLCGKEMLVLGICI